MTRQVEMARMLAMKKKNAQKQRDQIQITIYKTYQQKLLDIDEQTAQVAARRNSGKASLDRKAKYLQRLRDNAAKAHHDEHESNLKRIHENQQ